MPLIEVDPQRVEHTDGWAVASFDRYHIKYEEGNRVALAEVDNGDPTTRLYVSTVTWVDGSISTPPTADERARILRRLADGMAALGVLLELFDG